LVPKREGHHDLGAIQPFIQAIKRDLLPAVASNRAQRLQRNVPRLSVSSE